MAVKDGVAPHRAVVPAKAGTHNPWRSLVQKASVHCQNASPRRRDERNCAHAGVPARRPGRRRWFLRIHFSNSDMYADIVSHSRDTLRPRFANSSAPKKERAQATLKRGRREDRVRAAPAVSCARVDKKRTRAYRFSGNTPAFPAQWFYSLYRALPGETWLVCHRHS